MCSGVRINKVPSVKINMIVESCVSALLLYLKLTKSHCEGVTASHEHAVHPLCL